MMGDRVTSTRSALGTVGAFLPVVPGGGVTAVQPRDAVRRLEDAGYSAAWTNEVPGKDALVQAAILLAATERMTFGTCIANIWVRPPQTAHAAASQLSDAYPGRFILGLGVGRPHQAKSVGRDFGTPVGTARSYLAAMGDHEPRYPRILGAMGPGMLALAKAATDGALPAGGSPSQTAEARGVLGEQKLLIVYADITGENPAAAIRAHLDAGADQVIAGGSLGADFPAHIERLLRLAPELADLQTHR